MHAAKMWISCSESHMCSDACEKTNYCSLKKGTEEL